MAFHLAEYHQSDILCVTSAEVWDSLRRPYWKSTIYWEENATQPNCFVRLKSCLVTMSLKTFICISKMLTNYNLLLVFVFSWWSQCACKSKNNLFLKKKMHHRGSETNISPCDSVYTACFCPRLPREMMLIMFTNCHWCLTNSRQSRFYGTAKAYAPKLQIIED